MYFLIKGCFWLDLGIHYLVRKKNMLWAAKIENRWTAKEHRNPSQQAHYVILISRAICGPWVGQRKVGECEKEGHGMSSTYIQQGYVPYCSFFNSTWTFAAALCLRQVVRMTVKFNCSWWSFIYAMNLRDGKDGNSSKINKIIASLCVCTSTTKSRKFSSLNQTLRPARGRQRP